MHTATQQEPPHRYGVYGITLASDWEIPGLEGEKIPGNNSADIQVTLDSIPRSLAHLMEKDAAEFYVRPGVNAADPEDLVIQRESSGRYYHFTYAEGVDFFIDTHAAVVWCHRHDTLTLEDVALYLLGPVIGFLLRLMGTTCLHASGVLVNGNAIAITGASGAGKSTLAACFAAAGFPILTDDILPLTMTDGRVHTSSGYSRLRLFPNSFRNLPGLPDDLPLVAPGWDKCFLDLTSQDYTLHRHCAPLEIIYVLDWAADNRRTPSISPISASNAVPVLAANTYRNELLTSEMRAQEFLFLAKVASRVKVKRLLPVDDMATVPLLRDMLLSDIASETGQERTDPAIGEARYTPDP